MLVYCHRVCRHTDWYRANRKRERRGEMEREETRKEVVEEEENAEEAVRRSD